MVSKYLEGEVFISIKKWKISPHYLAYKTILSRCMLVCTFTKLYPHLVLSDCSFIPEGCKPITILHPCTYCMHIVISHSFIQL